MSYLNSTYLCSEYVETHLGFLQIGNNFLILSISLDYVTKLILIEYFKWKLSECQSSYAVIRPTQLDLSRPALVLKFHWHQVICTGENRSRHSGPATWNSYYNFDCLRLICANGGFSIHFSKERYERRTEIKFSVTRWILSTLAWRLSVDLKWKVNKMSIQFENKRVRFIYFKWWFSSQQNIHKIMYHCYFYLMLTLQLNMILQATLTFAKINQNQ